jgi:hypothetical protein
MLRGRAVPKIWITASAALSAFAADLLGTEHIRLVLYRLWRIRLRLINFRGFGLKPGVASQNIIHAPLYGIRVDGRLELIYRDLKKCH